MNSNSPSTAVKLVELFDILYCVFKFYDYNRANRLRTHHRRSNAIGANTQRPMVESTTSIDSLKSLDGKSPKSSRLPNR